MCLCILKTGKDDNYILIFKNYKNSSKTITTCIYVYCSQHNNIYYMTIMWVWDIAILVVPYTRKKNCKP